MKYILLILLVQSCGVVSFYHDKLDRSEQCYKIQNVRVRDKCFDRQWRE